MSDGSVSPAVVTVSRLAEHSKERAGNEGGQNGEPPTAVSPEQRDKLEVSQLIVREGQTEGPSQDQRARQQRCRLSNKLLLEIMRIANSKNYAQRQQRFGEKSKVEKEMHQTLAESGIVDGPMDLERG